MGNFWPRGAVFWGLGYVFGYVALLTVAIALSSALYLVAEYAEEFPTFAGKCVQTLLVLVVCLYLLLWLDGIPLLESCVGIGCHVVYASMLSTFPFVEVLSLRTVASGLVFLFSHYIWFSYFLNNSTDMLHVCGFFVIMVWAVPCGLFVSLSINDNILPGTKGMPSLAQETSTSGKGNNLFKAFYIQCAEKLGPVLSTVNSRLSRAVGQLGSGVGAVGGAGNYGRSKKGDDYQSGHLQQQQHHHHQQQQQQQYQQQYPQQQQQYQQQYPQQYPQQTSSSSSFYNPDGTGLKSRR